VLPCDRDGGRVSSTVIPSSSSSSSSSRRRRSLLSSSSLSRSCCVHAAAVSARLLCDAVDDSAVARATFTVRLCAPPPPPTTLPPTLPRPDRSVGRALDDKASVDGEVRVVDDAEDAGVRAVVAVIAGVVVAVCSNSRIFVCPPRSAI
jgi:hypothetical protein